MSTPDHLQNDSEAPKSNHLVNEKSPYLQQHSRNPVDWYPWGTEAFERARAEDKPIFLSIGYSTCHWCHVMAHESFEDLEVARLMNQAFVNVKVDREERPDIDAVYMTACQAMTGSGGWPLTIIMTPDKRPFFAGTYFPKTTRGRQIGIVNLIQRVTDLWSHNREDLLVSAGKFVKILQDLRQSDSPANLGEQILQAAYREFVTQFDGQAGGFGAAPKFPTPHHLLFLLRYWHRTGDSFALTMVEQTLQAMRRGGIYDHVGFGFHRYSTDNHWFVPHFEKMLYDQALLALAYLETYQVTQNNEYAQTAREIFTYVLRDLVTPEGAFSAAEDADSEGIEGKFYTWGSDEIRAIIPSDLAKQLLPIWGVKTGGNFHEEETGHPTNQNILHLEKSLPAIARDLGISAEKLQKQFEYARQILFKTRSQRVRPHRDDKVLTDWNALMIVALARGAWVLGDPAYCDAAQRAASFLLNNLRAPDGRLLHRFRNGQASIGGFLDDYIFLVWGLLELFEVTFDAHHLKTAKDLVLTTLAHFWDEREGGFYFTADDAEPLLVRKKESYDGAIPSGNAVAALVLVRLARILSEPALEEKAARIGQIFGTSIQQHPTAHTQLLLAVDYLLGPSHEIIIVGNPASEDTQEMLREVRRPFLPNKVVVVRPTRETSLSIDQFSPHYQYQKSINGQATAYVCQNHACKQPVTTSADLQEQLKKIRVVPN